MAYTIDITQSILWPIKLKAIQKERGVIITAGSKEILVKAAGIGISIPFG